MRPKTDKLKGYKPIDWSGESKLSKDQQEMVEIMRKDCWRHGIRKEPLLTRMAFELAAVACMTAIHVRHPRKHP